MHNAYIGVGSNLGDRSKNIEQAVSLLSSDPHIELIKQSHNREYKALTIGDEEQPDYINCVLQIQTSLRPVELMRFLKETETACGRPEKRTRWASRVIDLDILLFDSVVIDTEDLKIPHPEMEKRIFVLEPLCDIDPQVIHPVLQISAADLLRKIRAAAVHK